MAKWCIILLLGLLACLDQAFAGSSCVCLFKGQSFLIGDTACIMGSKRQCGMRLNNTSWIEISGGCDQDKLSMSIPPERAKRLGFELAHASVGDHIATYPAMTYLDEVQSHP